MRDYRLKNTITKSVRYYSRTPAIEIGILLAHQDFIAWTDEFKYSFFTYIKMEQNKLDMQFHLQGSQQPLGQNCYKYAVIKTGLVRLSPQ